ncbi:MAG TPA: hypothetical protein VFT87_04910 [Candidatus Saccharimonadales bacterium]|nr:hypothetical protein [Candidatus Saccharimonadales bacterium]
MSPEQSPLSPELNGDYSTQNSTKEVHFLEGDHMGLEWDEAASCDKRILRVLALMGMREFFYQPVLPLKRDGSGEGHSVE